MSALLSQIGPHRFPWNTSTLPSYDVLPFTNRTCDAVPCPAPNVWEEKHYYEILIIRDIPISVDFMDLLTYEIKNSAKCNVSSYNTMKISINEKK